MGQYVFKNWTYIMDFTDIRYIKVHINLSTNYTHNKIYFFVHMYRNIDIHIKQNIFKKSV